MVLSSVLSKLKVLVSKSSCIKSRAITITMLSYISRPRVSAALSLLVSNQTSVNTLVIVFSYPFGLVTFG